MDVISGEAGEAQAPHSIFRTSEDFLIQIV